jgi:hypothetical protein
MRGQQPLELGVLLLERLQPLGVRDLHAAELGLPRVERGAADPMPAAHLGRRHTSAGGLPASCSRKMPMICSSLNFDRFMVRSFLWAGL